MACHVKVLLRCKNLCLLKLGGPFFRHRLEKKASQASCSSVGGIMVSIAAFQAVDPGSIPGRRMYPLLLLLVDTAKMAAPAKSRRKILFITSAV